VVLIHPAYGSEADPLMEKGINRNLSNQEVLEPITVTAQKRKENIQKIPMSISAFSDIQIEDADIGNVQELTLLTPNVHMKKGASTNMLIFRGISNDADFIHAPASLYVDDICFSMNFMHNPDLFDIERIEVLRGPQGTLYGRNSESGVINIVTRQPDNDVTGKMFGEIAAYDPDHGSSMSYRTGLSLSGPLKKDTLYMGFAGQIETSDGFIKNSSTGSDEAGEIDHQNARLTTRWTPSNKLEISAILDILDIDDGNGNKRYDEGPWKTSPHEINYSTDRNVNEQKGNGQNIKVKYEGDHYNLLSITGRRFYENNMLRDSKWLFAIPCG
jgi:iron complex outermembrane receptor protein